MKELTCGFKQALKHHFENAILYGEHIMPLSAIKSLS